MNPRSAAVWLALLAGVAAAQSGGTASNEAEQAASGELPARGLVSRTDQAFAGYTLVGPLRSRSVYLVDLAGEPVHSWTTSEYGPGGGCYLEPDGHLLRCGRVDANPRFHGGGIGGVLEEFDWDGHLLWSYTLADEYRTQHHDLERLSNGNVLAIVWEYLSPEEARRFGRDEDAVGAEGLWPDAVLEIRPTPPAGGEVVWEWHAWDHLIQDRDPQAPYFGSIPDEPGRIDINADHRDRPPISAKERARQEELLAEMRDLGYVGGEDDPEEIGERRVDDDERRRPDWLHVNAVAYCPKHDLIALSSPHLCEIFVIDHSTTSEQAAGSTGGRFGHGGDLLWRWGNPRNYGCGTDADRQLFYQHDPSWLRLDDGLGMLVFNNGGPRFEREFSTVDELVLPFDPERGFLREPDEPFGPAAPRWQQRGELGYFSPFISGAQRLPNGNTLICVGAVGRIYEVTRDGTIVWDYLNPYDGDPGSTSTTPGAPPNALFRAYRYGVDDPAVSRLKP